MLTTDARAEDVSILTPDGLHLNAQRWSVSSPRGVVIISHGFGEHGSAYGHVARVIGPGAGVEIVAPDFRGHGRSPGKRGVVRRYEDLTTDLIAAFNWAGGEYPGLPRYILGHSNGGQVALRTAFDAVAGPSIAGLILSNPSLKLAVRVPAYKLRLGRFLLRRAPWVTLPAGLNTMQLTRDPEMRRERDGDPLCHGRISPPLYFGMVEGGRQILERPGELTIPILLILGGSDPIVDPVATREAFDGFSSTDKTLLLYPPMLHEPLSELGREKVYADIISWLDRRLPAG